MCARLFYQVEGDDWLFVVEVDGAQTAMETPKLSVGKVDWMIVQPDNMLLSNWHQWRGMRKWRYKIETDEPLKLG